MKGSFETQFDFLKARISELRSAVEDLAHLSGDSEGVRRLLTLAQTLDSNMLVQRDNAGGAPQSQREVPRRHRSLGRRAPHLQCDDQTPDCRELEFSKSGDAILNNTSRSVSELNQMSMKGLLPILSLRFQLSEMGDAVREALGATTPAEIGEAQQVRGSVHGHAASQDPSREHGAHQLARQFRTARAASGEADHVGRGGPQRSQRAQQIVATEAAAASPAQDVLQESARIARELVAQEARSRAWSTG